MPPYNAHEREAHWQAYWEEENTYTFDPKSNKPIYAIDTPPPTVSGKMHMGHASSFSQMDFIARYKRMKGFNLFYPFGTDDNGLATERLIEKLKGVKSSRMDRKEFVNLCLTTLDEMRPAFINDWKKIAISADYNIFYSTINDHSRKVSQKSFIDLYKMGREYRKESPTIWCPSCQTAIAQVELQDEELQSSFNDIIFKVDGENLAIATTRPELLPACAAIFFHPDDKRYQKYKGKTATVPLFNHDVPILPDPRADPEKGTGIVMCCTFGDQTDVEWYKAHNLPLHVAITKDGKMTERAGKYKGLNIKEARKAIIEELKEKNLLTNQKEITHAVNVHERCGTEIEILNSKQWFIKYLDQKEHFIKSGKQMNWFPQHMRQRYDNWIDGLQWDWCISRQRHFGVPFPVWYCKECGETKLADEKDLPVDPLTDKPTTPCEKCNTDEFEPEKDVLDTWATSSLTPHLAIELFKDKPVYKKLFPMQLRPQAHDIITFWLFNTVVKSHFHHSKNPWQDIMISGFVLDPKGRKMSKSKGNVIEPQEMIKKYNADALRFWAASTSLGDDMPFKEKELVAGQKFVTKLWNASSFCFTHLEDYEHKKPAKLEAFDRWVLSKLNRIIKISTENFEKYEYSKTKLEVEKFFWHTFCDNYLEIIKDRMYNPEQRGAQARRSAQYTLYTVLSAVLKLMAPITPHITEEVYHQYFAKKEKRKSVHQSAWPDADESMIDESIEQMGDIGADIITAARKFKSMNNVSLKEELQAIEIGGKTDGLEDALSALNDDLKAVTRAKEIKQGQDGELKADHFPFTLAITK